jgi:signal transduction histidine kinase/ligand-binding sensor domain-containing protein
VRSLSQLFHTAWTARDGAPPDVFALAQTPDGYLWVGGTAGLWRFDGVRFVPFRDVVSVQRLLVTRDGHLWVGYVGGGVSEIAGDSIRHQYGHNDGVSGGGIFALAQDSAGAIWVGAVGKLVKFDGRKFHDVKSSIGSQVEQVSSIIADRRGRVWVAGMEGIYRQSRNADGLELVERKPKQHSGAWDQYLAEAPDGTIWASDRRGLRIVDPAPNSADSSPRLPDIPDAIRLTVDRSGAVWIARHDGLQRVVPGLKPMVPSRERLTRDAGLSGSEVNAFFEDREGNMWIGTGGGIDRFRRPKLTRVELPAGTLGPFGLVAGDSGTVWAGPSSSPPMHIGSRRELFPAVQRRVDAADRDALGVVWFGGDSGLWQSTRGGFARVELPNVSFLTVQAIGHDDSGGTWISLTRDGTRLFRRVGGHWVANGDSPDMPEFGALVMTTDDSGRVWFGSQASWVASWNHGRLRVYGDKQGLHMGMVFALNWRAGHMWVGGEKGLAVIAGDRVRFIQTSGGPALRMVTGVAELSNGELWLHGGFGIARVAAAEVRRTLADTSHEMTAEWLDYRDGLNGGAPLGPFPSMIQSSDGRLWFTTNLELASIDPSHIARNTRPPNVVIEKLTAGEKAFPATTGVTLPAHTRSLRIEYTALSLSIPDRVRFRYRLEGSGEDDWQDVGGRREAVYTNLKPGSYQFRVIAANEDGVWNESGATLRFDIPPSFTESRWFFAVWAGLFVAVVWLIYQLRMRRVAAGLRTRYDVALAERTRIAQELHDTLLQGFTGITIRLRAIQRVIERRPEQGVAALDTALADADTALRDARNAIWDMRAVELEGRDLPEALEGAVRSTMSGTAVGLEFSVRGTRRPLTPEIETVALRVGREAVANALKHASATTIAVSLDYGSQALTLEIRDDGEGIAAGAAEAASANGHLGIAGMRARTHGAGGTINIESEPGRGTMVRMVMPVK